MLKNIEGDPLPRGTAGILRDIAARLQALTEEENSEPLAKLLKMQ